MTSRAVLISAALIVQALNGLAAQSAFAVGSVTNLGTLSGWPASYGSAISADGTVVAGYAYDSNLGTGRAFRWTSATGMLDIGSAPGFTHAAAYGMSGDGSVLVGSSYGNVFQTSRATRWMGGSIDNLGVPSGAQYSIAKAVSSDGGVIAGFYRLSGGNDRAFRWTPAGGIQSLGLLPGTTAADALGMSADGSVVVGESGNSAYRWTQAGGMQDLGQIPGSGSAVAEGVSANGAAVIGYCTVGVNQRAFRWAQAGGMQDLGVLPGGTESHAYAVSADGSVVVGMGRPLAGLEHAFVWSGSRGMLDLNSYLPTLGFDLSGWTLSYATAVSADGSSIAGEGIFNGTRRAWLARDVPSPSVGVAMVVGGLLGTRRRRRHGHARLALEVSLEYRRTISAKRSCGLASH